MPWIAQRRPGLPGQSPGRLTPEQAGLATHGALPPTPGRWLTPSRTDPLPSAQTRDHDNRPPPYDSACPERRPRYTRCLTHDPDPEQRRNDARARPRGIPDPPPEERRPRSPPLEPATATRHPALRQRAPGRRGRCRLGVDRAEVFLETRSGSATTATTRPCRLREERPQARCRPDRPADLASCLPSTSS